MRAGAAALVVALVACRPGETEIVVTVDTTFGVPCTIDSLVFEVEGRAEEIPVTDADLPGSLTLTTDSAHAALVTVTGMREGEPFAAAQEMATFDEGNTLELRFLLDRSCVPGPCPAIGIGGYVDLPEPVARRGCGQEGYLRADSLFVMRDACDMDEAISGNALAGADELEVPSPLAPAMPFPFRFYGEPVDSLWVGDNGYLGFSVDAPHALVGDVGSSRSLGDPTGSFPVPGVLPFWDDLRTGPKGVCFATSGKTPDRILWITWKEACFKQGLTACGGPLQGTLTFSVALEETTDRIFIGYQTMIATGGNADRAKGLTATIGITNKGPKACDAAACSAGGTCPSGEPCGFTELSARKIVDPLPTLELVPQ